MMRKKYLDYFVKKSHLEQFSTSIKVLQPCFYPTKDALVVFWRDQDGTQREFPIWNFSEVDLSICQNLSPHLSNIWFLGPWEEFSKMYNPADFPLSKIKTEDNPQFVLAGRLADLFIFEITQIVAKNGGKVLYPETFEFGAFTEASKKEISDA